MTAVSTYVAERARKFHSLSLQRIATVGQNQIAEQLQVSEATVSRFVGTDLERACHVLSILGLKVVPAEMKCYPKDQIDAIFTLARASMNRVADVEQLSFES
jgi:hypothetical protein